jgi:uncharacterized cupin superfamily protein
VSAVSTLAPVGAVADLRSYAEGTTPSGDWIAGRATPVFADEAAVVAALAPRGSGQVDALAADEFVIVLSGRLDIESAAGPLQLEANQSGMLPAGVSFGWRAAEDTLVIIVSVAAAEPGQPSHPIVVDENAELSPSNPPLPELLVGPTPSCRGHCDYTSANGEFKCGTWDSTPYHRVQMPYAHIELMHLLAGSVTFTDKKGSTTFKTGDVVLAMRGEGCAWFSDEYVKKVYATHRPLA